MSRRIALGVLTAAAVALALASVAYACTTVRGATTVTPTSGTPGTTVTATGTNAPAGSRAYDLRFLNFKSDRDSMNTCMSGSLLDPDQKIGGPTTSDASGNIAATTGVIPAGAKQTPGTNVAWICFVSSGYGYATGPASFTVL